MPKLASANRDAAKNIDPNTIGIRREQPNHVSFGYGNQLCLVLSLARLKARMAIDALLESHPGTILAGQEVDWQTGALACGMKHLFVETGRQRSCRRRQTHSTSPVGNERY